MTEKNRLQEYCQKNKIALPVYSSWSIGEAHKQQWSANVTIIVKKAPVTINTIVASISKSSAEKQAALLMLDNIKSQKNNSHHASQLTKLQQATKLSITSTHKKKSDSSKLLEVDLSSDSTSSIIDDLNVEESENVLDNDIINVSDDEISSNTSDKFNGLIAFKNIYLIDLENKPAFRTKTKNNCLYIGFINSIHHSLIKYNNWYKCISDDLAQEITTSKSNKLLYLIEGGTVDLVDHFMTAFVYPIVNFVQKMHSEFENANASTDSIYNSCIVSKSIEQQETILHIISGDHAGWCTRACFEKVIKWRKITNIVVTNAASIN